MPGAYGDQNVVSVQRYQSGPPVSKYNNEEDEESIAVTKEEEIVVKKRREEKTTRQTETHVKRQVVLEDGRIVEDSGPTITNNTTEDIQLQENEQTEHLTRGGEVPTEGWVALPGAVIVRDKTEKKTNIHDEKEERLETEETRHLKNFTNDDIVRAIRDNTDLRTAVARRQENTKSLNSTDETDNALVPKINRRILHQSKKHKRIIDEEDIKEHSEERDGKVVTEVTKNEHHEEVDTEEVPDDSGRSHSSIHEITKETKNNYNNRKHDEQVDYMAIPKGGPTGCRILASGPAQLLSDQKPEDATDDSQWESLSDRIRRARQIQERPKGPAVQREPTPERKDALTQKPLDLDEEEETRKIETSKWLESHFGSESSHGSTERKDTQSPGINVTLRSKKKEKAPEDRKPYIPEPPPIPKEGQKIPSTVHTNPKPREEESPKPVAPWKIGDRIQVLPVGPGNQFFKRETSPTVATPRKNKASPKPPGINVIPPTPSTQLSTPFSGTTVKRSQSFNVMPRSQNSAWKKEEPQVKSPPPVPVKAMRTRNSFKFDSKPAEKYQSMMHLRDKFSPERQVEPEPRYPSAQQLNYSGSFMERSKTETDLYAIPMKKEKTAPPPVTPPVREQKKSDSESTPSQSRVRRISPDFEYQQVYKSPSGMREIKPKYAYTEPDAAKPTPEPPLTPRRKSPPSRLQNVSNSVSPGPLSPVSPQPPRPAPPRIVAKVTPLPETTIKQPAVEEFSPPVRPIRRKQKQKTDSGTQTNVYETQTLDRKRPSKSYYLGEIGTDFKVEVNALNNKYSSSPSATAQRRIEEYNNKVNASVDNDYVSRSQTLPRSPKKSAVLPESPKEKYIYSEKKEEEIEPVKAPPRVTRSQSFQQKQTKVRPFSRFDPVKISFSSTENEPLKSPGIISSISKSQHDLTKGENGLERKYENTALYTLPRKRSEAKRPEPENLNYLTEKRVELNGPKSAPAKVISKSTVNLTTPEMSLQRESSFARRFPTNQGEQTPNRFFHRQENEKENVPKPPFRREKTTGEMNISAGVRQKKQLFEQPIKTDSSTLPRVIGGKVKQSNPVTRRESLSPTSPSDEKRKQYLQSLLKTAPELYMTLHGTEESQINKSPVTSPKPGGSPPPPLVKAESPPSSPDVKYETPRKNRFEHIYTSTPVLNKVQDGSQGQYYAPVTNLSYTSNTKSYHSLGANQSSGYDTGSRNNVYSPASSKTLERAKSPFSSGSTPVPASSINSRRQSRDLVAPLRSPPPENYTETIRVKSSKPQTYGDSETDYVQRYSKKTVPTKDGYTTEVVESSENTTHSRSSYKESDGNRRPDNSYSYVEVRPRESGGVIIQLRSGDGRRY